MCCINIFGTSVYHNRYIYFSLLMGTINVILGYLLNCSFTLLKGSFDKTSYYFCFKVSQKLKIIIIQNKKTHTHTHTKKTLA